MCYLSRSLEKKSLLNVVEKLEVLGFVQSFDDGVFISSAVSSDQVIMSRDSQVKIDLRRTAVVDQCYKTDVKRWRQLTSQKTPLATADSSFDDEYGFSTLDKIWVYRRPVKIFYFNWFLS